MSLAADDSNNTDMEDYRFLCQPCILVSHPVCVCVCACAVSRLHAFIQSASLQTSMNYTLHIIGVVPSFRFKHTVARRTFVNSTHPHPQPSHPTVLPAVYFSPRNTLQAITVWVVSWSSSRIFSPENLWITKKYMTDYEAYEKLEEAIRKGNNQVCKFRSLL